MMNKRLAIALDSTAVFTWLIWALLGVWSQPFDGVVESAMNMGFVVFTLTLNTVVILLTRRSQFVDFVKICGLVVNSLVFLGLAMAFVISVWQSTEWIDTKGGIVLMLTVTAPLLTVAAIAVGRRGTWWEWQK